MSRTSRSSTSRSRTSRSRTSRSRGRRLAALTASGAALGTITALLAGAPAQAATAGISLEGGVLAVSGGAGRDSLSVGRTPAGAVTVNGAEVDGGTVTVDQVRFIVLDGGAGDDALSIDERNGRLPPGQLIGGDGNDRLSGGSGDDSLFGGSGVDTLDGRGGDDLLVGDAGNDKATGGAGDDVALLGDDSDQFTWNPGDGSDFVDGGGGKDTMIFNGSAANEIVDLTADGSRVRLTRNVAGVAMSIGGMELLKTNLSSGQDQTQIGDLTGTDLAQLQLTHQPPNGADSGFDTVSVFGSSRDDRIRLFGPSAAGTVTVGGLAVTLLVSGAEQLNVHGLAGDDVIDGGRLGGGAVSLQESGEAGDDVLVGTPGDDVLQGGADDDRLEGRGGRDVLDGGAGNNVIVP